jgi:hypothetical protein
MSDEDRNRGTRSTQAPADGRVVTVRVEFKRAPRPPGMTERLEKLFREIAQRARDVRQAA